MKQVKRSFQKFELFSCSNNVNNLLIVMSKKNKGKFACVFRLLLSKQYPPFVARFTVPKGCPESGFL